MSTNVLFRMKSLKTYAVAVVLVQAGLDLGEVGVDDRKAAIHATTSQISAAFCQ